MLRLRGTEPTIPVGVVFERGFVRPSSIADRQCHMEHENK